MAIQLLENRKFPLHYFAHIDGKMVRMPREHGGWDKRQTVSGLTLTSAFKPVKSTIQMPMAEYIGVPSFADEGEED